MSYDITLCDPATGEDIEFDSPHDLRGGTYQVGGTTRAWLNITYNYSGHYERVIGKKGIRSLYGLPAAETIPILERAIAQLGNDVSEDYWEPTEGNAKRALIQLLALAKRRPDGIWSGD